MLKAALILIGLAFTSIIAWRKRVEARARLSEIENGERCLSCDGKEMQRVGETIRCAVCGHTESATTLKANKLSASEIDEMSRPDGR